MTAIGIDLGTSYSCVGVFQHGKVEIIPNDRGNRTTPNYIAFTKTERLIGDAAKNQVILNSSNTVFDTKRLIGRKFDDSSVQSDMKYWPFAVISDGGKPKFQVEFKGEKKTFLPEEISSMMLIKMKEIAETYLGKPVTNAVITVPAYFNNFQRQATLDAGAIAGLNVLRIFNEPSAAAITYGLGRKCTEDNILIFDLGGGTFDVTILTMDDNGIFYLKSTSGDTHLGGEDFDNCMLNHFVQEFEHKHKKNLATNKRALSKLRKACECAKRTLSTSFQAIIQIDSLFEGADFYSTITRTRFEDLNEHLFNSMLASVEKALQDANMDKYEIHDIVLVGGSTRIPKIQKLLQNFFNGKELNKSIHPDEGIAYGASIQAAILMGGVRSMQAPDLLFLEIIPLPLSIHPVGDMIGIFKRNSSIPTRQTQTFTTDSDNQSRLLMEVYEGECDMTNSNNLLGEFELIGISPVPSGVPQIQVDFDIDVNGILSISLNNSTDKGISLVQSNGRLSNKEIERMVRDAEKYRDDDDKQRIRMSLKNSLESFAIDIQSTIEGHRKILHKISDTLKWLDSNPFAEKEDLCNKQNELEMICNKTFFNL